MQSPIISIIIPVFNASHYLNDCIQSVLVQTFTHFELLLIDDGSTDNSYEILKKWSLQDNRIKVYHRHNAGASATRNFGLNISKGDWILFIDSDDVVLPDYCLDLFQSVEFDVNRVLAVSGIQVYRNGKPAEVEDFPNLNCDVRDFKRLFGNIKIHKYGFSVGKLYKRTILDRFNLRFDEHICIAEDCVFMLNYLMSCVGLEKPIVSFIDKCDYLYFIRQNSLSTSVSSVERELYSYNHYRYTICRIRDIFKLDEATFISMYSSIVYYADRVLNSIYKNIESSRERRRFLQGINIEEYLRFKKVYTAYESFIVFLLSKRMFRFYDFFRRLI